MSDNDPKGYYRCLGVHPDAPASVIKAAYRTLAKELHPDRNKDSASTAAFQAIQEAYETLSDGESRRQYDADSAVPVTEASGDEEDVSAPLEPVRCAKCSAITAQPKFKVFYTVVGYLVGATQKPHQGVFCSKCELTTALSCSAVTLVVGWWSIAGFLLTLETLLKNLVGGRFHAQNARLQAHQAFYFAQSGQLELARAVAMSALANAEQAKGKNLGPKDNDPLGELKSVLTAFVDSIPADVKRVKLKSSNDVFNRRFAYQSALLAAAVATVLSIGYAIDRQDAAVEAERLERLGIERERAAAIASREAATLKSLEQPLPPTSVMSGNYDEDTNPPFQINNSPDAHTLLKLVSVDTGAEVIAVFVRAGEQISIGVPVGEYHAKIASGQTWYGEAIRFGPKTSYAKLDSVFRFTVKGQDLLGHEVTLSRVSNGNLSRTAISASAF